MTQKNRANKEKKLPKNWGMIKIDKELVDFGTMTKRETKMTQKNKAERGSKDWCMCDHKIKPGEFIAVDGFNPLTCAICKKELPFGTLNPNNTLTGGGEE